MRGVQEPIVVATLSELPHRSPVGVSVEGMELVVLRMGDDEVSVLAGRCLHRGARLADGRVDGDDLICSLHGWDYRALSGVSAYDPSQRLHRYEVEVVGEEVRICAHEVKEQATVRPTSDVTETPVGIPATRSDAVAEYEWHYENPHNGPEEDRVEEIHALALHGLSVVGHHGPVAAMGVPRQDLPSWDHLQFLTAQLHRFPLFDDDVVGSDVTIGPGAASPLRLGIPLFVSDMSFGALSEEAKVALAMGAELAGTGICSGEGGMLPEEQQANSRYFYELACGAFGWDPALVSAVQAFHFKFGQGAKTGTGGHLPGPKVVGRIAEVRGLPPGTPAVSPGHFTDLHTVEQFAELAEDIEASKWGSPHRREALRPAHRGRHRRGVGDRRGLHHPRRSRRRHGRCAAHLPRQHLGADHAGARPGPAASRPLRCPRRHPHDHRWTPHAVGLRQGDGVGGRRGGSGQFGHAGDRLCGNAGVSHRRCPVGIATQDPVLRARLPVQQAAERLARFLMASTDLMAVLARACGHDRLDQFDIDDLTTFDREVHHLTGVAYGGVLP